jgi:hypothetical protein
MVIAAKMEVAKNANLITNDLSTMSYQQIQDCLSDKKCGSSSNGQAYFVVIQ